MREIMISSDPVAIGYAEAVLSGAGIAYHVADRAMSVMQGSLALLPVRLLVDSERFAAAHRLLAEAGLGASLVEAR